MRFKGLDLNLLVVFDTVANERNITRAAEKLNLTQSAVSSALKRLRHFFDDELLIPSGRRLLLTSRAEILLPEIKAVLGLIERKVIEDPLLDPKEAVRHTKIMTSDYVTLTSLGQALARIRQEAPHLTFEVQQVVDNPERALDRHDADLMITLEPLTAPNHPKRSYMLDDYVCIMDASHPLARSKLTLESYLAQEHAVVRFSRSDARPWEEQSLARAGHNKKIAVMTSSFATLQSCVVGTNLIATLYRRLAQHSSHSPQIVVHDFPIDLPPAHEFIQWHTMNNDDPVLQWIIGRLVEEAKEA